MLGSHEFVNKPINDVNMYLCIAGVLYLYSIFLFTPTPPPAKCGGIVLAGVLRSPIVHLDVCSAGHTPAQCMNYLTWHRPGQRLAFRLSVLTWLNFHVNTKCLACWHACIYYLTNGNPYACGLAAVVSQTPLLCETFSQHTTKCNMTTFVCVLFPATLACQNMQFGLHCFYHCIKQVNFYDNLLPAYF